MVLRTLEYINYFLVRLSPVPHSAGLPPCARGAPHSSSVTYGRLHPKVLYRGATSAGLVNVSARAGGRMGPKVGG
ncbi:hypothetical protein GCM10009712_44210 [Pseudarthrobacter sulfonivorans]